MTLQLPVRKQTLRFVLGLFSFIIPVATLLGAFILSKDGLLFTSIHSYLSTELRPLVMWLLIIYGVIFMIYALIYSKSQLELLSSGVLLIILAMLPDTSSWMTYVQQLSLVLFLAVLGWHLHRTFNLPLGFPVLVKIGTMIWVLDFVLLVWLLAFPSLWPPFGFLLETIILWLFTAGIFIRHQINKKLGG